MLVTAKDCRYCLSFCLLDVIGEPKLHFVIVAAHRLQAGLLLTLLQWLRLLQMTAHFKLFFREVSSWLYQKTRADLSVLEALEDVLWTLH